ncbi:hypothetical protein Ccrd_014955 [Cynara cardunculus var. scolymus]|uniref:Uncharacterized protein n=1 Tax=Cynara cardunculus var. scolymus TaxID=59895 RepID=A0A118K3Y5_CYNCS|nr:hypothetical protein Ccrd_014955 [Cynara cardunculus var. scolymus]
MARSSNYFIIKVLLLLNYVSVNIVARPIIVAKSIDCADDVIIGAIDIFSLAAIKSSKRHEFPTADSFGMIKNSGPSPGGKGHGFSDAESFGNIKSSGPSAGGKGHDLPTSVKTLGNILKSGPSRGSGLDETTSSGQRFGSKRQMVTVSGNLWDLKNSGPSPGGKGH